MSNPKSAKDLAFDKERAKYRKQIRELESNLKKRDADVVKLQMEINKQSEEINQLKDWVARLLEYTELSEEEMKNIIDKDKNSDVYIVAKDYSWTYVRTHEYGLGPYFSMRPELRIHLQDKPHVPMGDGE